MAVKKAFAECRVIVSPQILTEYRSIPLALKTSGKITSAQFKALVAGIAAFVAGAHVVTPRRSIRICRDPYDDMLIECCVEAKAAILLSGDKDLLSLTDTFPWLKIMRPKVFVEEPA